MAHCKDCIHFNVCEAFGKTVKFPVDDGVCLHFAKDINVPTNADRIRSMSDEELRNWLFQRDCTNIAAFLEYGGMGVMDAVQLLDWLKQPAEGE